MLPARLLLSLLAGLALLAPLPVAAQADAVRPELGLMGTIPIYWGETDGLGDLINGKSEPHWARAELENTWNIKPLSYLSEEALAPLENLLLAQPRALSGEENVALDAWVRGGGHLLLFADPAMTGHSRYSIGDRRRPQDVVMLSPILGHWGLRLELLDDQPQDPAVANALGISLPVEIPGRFMLVGGEGECTLSETQVLAQCAIGKGSATIVADAAMLDMIPSADSIAALQALSARAFGKTGEIAGQHPGQADHGENGARKGE